MRMRQSKSSLTGLLVAALHNAGLVMLPSNRLFNLVYKLSVSFGIHFRALPASTGLAILYRKGEQPFTDADMGLAEMIAAPTAVSVLRNE